MIAIIRYLLTGDCRWACDHALPYGWVPECSCPVHDPENWLYVIMRSVVRWLRPVEKAR